MTRTGTPFVVGVDGGNTKTVALAVTPAGAVLGSGRGGTSDVYGAASVDEALREIERAVAAALEAAGCSRRSPVAAAFCLAGADWPEDFELYRQELRTRLAWECDPTIWNDAIAGVWAADPRGVGVSVACGTWSAIGARAEDGTTWHSSFWTEPSGAAGIAQGAFDALVRSELRIAEAEALTARLLELYAVRDATELLHLLTRRAGRLPVQERARAAQVVLDAAADGDETALGIVRRHARLLAEYALAGSRVVGLAGDPFRVTLTGGMFERGRSPLSESIVEEIGARDPLAVVEPARLPPVAGAVQLALHEAGGGETAAAVSASLAGLVEPG